MILNPTTRSSVLNFLIWYWTQQNPNWINSLRRDRKVRCISSKVCDQIVEPATTKIKSNVTSFNWFNDAASRSQWRCSVYPQKSDAAESTSVLSLPLVFSLCLFLYLSARDPFLCLLHLQAGNSVELHFKSSVECDLDVHWSVSVHGFTTTTTEHQGSQQGQTH